MTTPASVRPAVASGATSDPNRASTEAGSGISELRKFARNSPSPTRGCYFTFAVLADVLAAVV